MCQRSKWQAIERLSPFWWFITYVRQKTGFCLFSALFFFPATPSPHIQSCRDTRLLAYLPGFTNIVLCCTRHLHTVLIYHRVYYQRGSFCSLSLLSSHVNEMTVVNVFLCLPFFRFVFPAGASGQRVKVEPEVLSYPGQTVNLRCSFSDPTGVQLTMVRNPFSRNICFSFFCCLIFLLTTKK